VNHDTSLPTPMDSISPPAALSSTRISQPIPKLVLSQSFKRKADHNEKVETTKPDVDAQLPKRRNKKRQSSEHRGSSGGGDSTLSIEGLQSELRKKRSWKKRVKAKQQAQGELEQAVCSNSEVPPKEFLELRKKRKRRNKRPKHDRQSCHGSQIHDSYSSLLLDGSMDVYDLPESPGYENRDEETVAAPSQIGQFARHQRIQDEDHHRSPKPYTKPNLSSTKRKRESVATLRQATLQSIGDSIEDLYGEERQAKKIRNISETNKSPASNFKQATATCDAQTGPGQTAFSNRVRELEDVVQEAKSPSTKGLFASPTPPPRFLSPELGDLSLISPAIVAAARPRPRIRERFPEVAESVYGGDDWATPRGGNPSPSPSRAFRSSLDVPVEAEPESGKDLTHSDDNKFDHKIQHAVDTQILSDMFGTQEDHPIAIANGTRVAPSDVKNENVSTAQQGFHRPMICQIL
jgi:hypothetical protein